MKLVENPTRIKIPPDPPDVKDAGKSEELVSVDS